MVVQGDRNGAGEELRAEAKRPAVQAGQATGLKKPAPMLPRQSVRLC